MIAIACMEQHTRGIGYQNKLLFNIKEDMKFFKEETYRKRVVMGRKTFESMDSKPLPNRTNIIITSTPEYYSDGDAIFISMDTFLDYINNVSDTDNIYVIGGAQLYKELLPYCDKILLTEVDDKNIIADTFFPEFTYPFYNTWICHQGSINENNGLKYRFNTYYKSSPYNGPLKYCDSKSPKDDVIL